MTRFHAKGHAPGTPVPDRVQFTQAEEDAKDAQEVADAAALPLKEWQAEMNKLDETMSRAEEDIIDSMDATQRGRLPQVVRDRRTTRQTRRANRP